MRGDVAVAGLQATVANRLKAEAGGIVASGLLGIADVEGDVIESQVAADLRLGALVSVGSLQTETCER